LCIFIFLFSVLCFFCFSYLAYVVFFFGNFVCLLCS